MKRLVFMFLSVFSLSGCGTLGVDLANGGTALHGFTSAMTYLETSSEERRKIRNADLENMCTAQLRGSVENWPSVCPDTLSKMDACGRIGFDSMLCKGEIGMRYNAKYFPDENPSQSPYQEVQASSSGSAKKISKQKNKPTKFASKKKKKGAEKIMPAKLKL